MKVRYVGPEGQENREIGQALAEQGDVLEPGGVYDVDAALGKRLVESSAHFKRVTNYEKLSVEALREIAAEYEIEGRGEMKKDALVKAIREAEA